MIATHAESSSDAASSIDPDEAERTVLSARVVLLTNFVPPYRVPLLEALVRRVSSLTVLTSTTVEPNRSWKPDAGSLDVRVQRTWTLRRSWKHPSGFVYPKYVHIPWDTLLQLRRLHPDVVISGELGFRSLFAAVYCTSSRRTKLILWATLSERTELGRGHLRHVLRRWLAARADRVIVNGASGERYLLRLGCPREKIDRLPQPALPEFAKVGELARPSTRVQRLIFVGQLTELKGLVPFIHELDAWAVTHQGRRLELTIVGSGPLSREIESIRHGANLEIKLTGELDPSALSAHYARADALVFPTLADEWGLVVNEALAAGVPVLGSIHSQAVVDLCEDGSNGWLFDPEDELSTRSAIDRMLATGESELAAMRVRARERVRDMTPAWAASLLAASIETALARMKPAS